MIDQTKSEIDINLRKSHPKAKRAGRKINQKIDCSNLREYMFIVGILTKDSPSCNNHENCD